MRSSGVRNLAWVGENGTRSAVPTQTNTNGKTGHAGAGADERQIVMTRCDAMRVCLLVVIKRLCNASQCIEGRGTGAGFRSTSDAEGGWQVSGWVDKTES